MWWDTKKICTLVKEYRERKRPTLSHSYTYDRRLVQARRGSIGDQQVLPGLPTNRPQCKPFCLNKFLSGVFVQFSQNFCVWDFWRKCKEWLRFSMAKMYLRTYGIWSKLVGSPKFRFFVSSQWKTSFQFCVKFQMPSTPQMRKANEKNAKNVTKRGQVRPDENTIQMIY